MAADPRLSVVVAGIRAAGAACAAVRAAGVPAEVLHVVQASARHDPVVTTGADVLVLVPDGLGVHHAQAWVAGRCTAPWTLWLHDGDLPGPGLLDALSALVDDDRHTHLRLVADDGRVVPRLVRTGSPAVQLAGAPDAEVEAHGAWRAVPDGLRTGQDAPPAGLRVPAEVHEPDHDELVACWPARPFEAEAYAARVEVVDPDRRFAPGTGRTVLVRVTNDGTRTWPWTDAGREVRLTYAWERGDGGVRVPEGLRSRLPGPVPPGGEVLALLSVAVPEPGSYVLHVDLVDEGVRHFGTPARIAVDVA